MRQALISFLRIPPEIRDAFWQNSLQKNRLSLLVICIMIFGMELYNIARVLFLSSSGLGTLNNRIYFGLYCSLLGAAVLSLLLQQATRRASAAAQWAVQYGSVLFFLLWHVCLNAYDLSRNPGGPVGVFLTAVLALAIFIQMPCQYSIPCYAGAYLLFLALTRSTLDSGDGLNLTFTTIVALAVSMTAARHAVVMLSQQREIDQMNAHLHALLRLDPLTELLNKTAFQDRGEELLAQDAQGLSLFIIDLDNFKAVNDRYGHPCGDYVLKATALLLQSVFPPGADIGRIGGDEFACLLPGRYGADALRRISGQLSREVAAIRWRGQDVGAGCSVGICRAPRGTSYEQCYQEADRALYQAKGSGRGGCALSQLS